MSTPANPDHTSTFTGVNPSAGTHPVEIIADFERRARRFETDCGDGKVIWRGWGDGPALVLLHGAQGAWSHWIRNIDALSETRTVWAPDIPGYGDSADPPAEDQGAIARTLAEGLSRLVPRQLPIDVVAFSFGGTTAAVLAAEYPGLVKRLILVDAGGLGTPLGDFSLQRVRGRHGEERRAAHRANRLGFMLHDPASVDELALHLQETNIARARLNPGPLMMPDQLLRALRHVSAPVSAIWGERDRAHPAADQEAALRAILPNIDFRIIGAAGHWVMYEQPTAFADTLLELLAVPAAVVP